MNLEFYTQLLLVLIFFFVLNYIAFKKKVSKKISGIILITYVFILLSPAVLILISQPYGPGEALAVGLLLGFVFVALLLTPFILPVFVLRLIKNQIALFLIYLPGGILLFFVFIQLYSMIVKGS